MDLELMLEAEKRGLLPQDKADLLSEARVRGIVPSADQPKSPGGLRDSWLGGVVRGMRDIPDAGAQLVTRGLEAMAPSGSRFESWARGERERVEQINREAEREYRQDWRGGKDLGIDWSRIGGNVVGSAPLAAVAPIGTAATTAGRALQAARAGAIGSAFQPVTETDDYWSQKALQVGIGGATAGVASPVLERATGAVSALAGRGVDATRAMSPASVEKTSERTSQRPYKRVA